jgi:ectoine hydroxylase-related dioxygenase (phytanoyl-CoA dioxygenase family)
LGGLRQRGVFDALAVPAVVAAISELLDTDTWPRPFSWGDPLVTMPAPGRWAVPDTGWHIDFPARSALRLKWLAYLAPVPAAGGGTVVLAGSHRLVDRFLRDNPADPGRSATVRDTVLAAEHRTVVELSGEPGDMVFMHPHLFHAPAPNHSSTPRLMATGGLAY